MKRIRCFLYSVIFVAATLPANAQPDSTINLPNFLLPAFTRSIIKFKSGDTKTAMLNYNIIDQEMVFKQADGYMVLDNPEVIDTLLLDDRKFVPFKTVFYEVLLTGHITLFMQHKSNVETQGTQTGYGATSNTQGVTYVRQMYGPIGSVNLKISDDFKLVEDDYYWVKSDNMMERFTNKHQFLKIFKTKEKELTQFIDKSSISFKKSADVIKLVNYCSQL